MVYKYTGNEQYKTVASIFAVAVAAVAVHICLNSKCKLNPNFFLSFLVKYEFCANLPPLPGQRETAQGGQLRAAGQRVRS